jgi:hypothetical protein
VALAKSIGYNADEDSQLLTDHGYLCPVTV